MSNPLSVKYTIDAEDNICFVDQGWCQFAEENDGAELVGSMILGQSLWDHITDATTANLYRQIVSRVRKGKLARFSLRCDSPACRRLLEMTISARPDGLVEFETKVMHEEEREPVALLSRKITRSNDVLRLCAWCNRMDVGHGANNWMEVEDATKHLRLFEQGSVPQLTHGMCEECLASMMGTIDNMDANAESG